MKGAGRLMDPSGHFTASCQSVTADWLPELSVKMSKTFLTYFNCTNRSDIEFRLNLKRVGGLKM